jgi:hypothetical protein
MAFGYWNHHLRSGRGGELASLDWLAAGGTALLFTREGGAVGKLLALLGVAAALLTGEETNGNVRVMEIHKEITSSTDKR